MSDVFLVIALLLSVAAVDAVRRGLDRRRRQALRSLTGLPVSRVARF